MIWKIFSILNFLVSFFFRGLLRKKIRYLGINLALRITILIWCIDVLGWTFGIKNWIWCWSGIFQHAFLYFPLIIIWIYGLFGVLFLSSCFISNKWWRLPYVKDLFYALRNEMNHFSEYNVIANMTPAANSSSESQPNNNF